MRLVIVDKDNVIVADYGAFTPEKAEAFFSDAIAALSFQKQFPQAAIRNEVQLHLLTDTLNRMGLLHGNPEAMEAWMRPYIANEILRQNQKNSIYYRTKAKIDDYREKTWDWIKAGLFGGVSKLISKIFNRLRK